MKKGKVSVGTVLIMIAFAAGGYFAARFGISAAQEWPPAKLATLVIMLIPAFLLVIAAHEAGHAIAGHWVKFDFRMYVVGPFMWEKEESGWKFKWNKNVNVSGGMVICLPTNSEDLGNRFAIYAIGGPVASLVFAGINGGLYLGLSLIEDSLVLTTLASVFGLMAFLSALIFLATIIPLQASGFSSDGARVLRLLRKGDTSRFETLLLKIISSSTAGTRPSKLDMQELEEAQELASRLNAPMGIYLNSYFYQAALDRGDFAQAERHLQNYILVVDDIPEGIRGAVWLDAAFFYAFAKRDLGTATLHWERFKPSAILPKSQVEAAEAAMHFLRQEYTKSITKIDSALKGIPNMIDQGVGIALSERLSELRQLCLEGSKPKA